MAQTKPQGADEGPICAPLESLSMVSIPAPIDSVAKAWRLKFFPVC